MEKTKKVSIKRAVTLMLALAVLISSVIISTPQTTQAATKYGITLDKKYTTLYVGETYTLKAKKLYKDGRLIATSTNSNDKAALSYKKFTFKTSNSKIATVSKKGVITAKKKGNVTITMRSIYDSRIKVTIKLKVKSAKKPAITLKKKTATIGVGNTTKMSVKSVKYLSTKTVTYKTSNKKIATVNSKGVVTGKKAGTATITVISSMNKKATTKFKVTVKTQDTLNTTISSKGKAKITLAETEVTLAPVSSFSKDESDPTYWDSYWAVKRWGVENQKKYGQAQIKIKSISGLKNANVTYKSSNTGIATVSSTGFVTPKRAGVAMITVASKDKPEVTAQYCVTVKNLAAYIDFQNFDCLRLKPNEREIEIGRVTKDGYRIKSLKFEICPQTADNTNFKVFSSDSNIIQVVNDYDEYGDSDCNLIIKKKGKVTLTIKSDDGYVTEKWTITVEDHDYFYAEGVSDPQP